MDETDDRLQALVHHLVSQLRSHRESRGLSAGQLATLSGLRPETVHGVEGGRTSPSLAVLLAMTTALGISLADLISESEIEIGLEALSEGVDLLGSAQPMLERLIDCGGKSKFAFVVTDETRVLVFSNRILMDLCGHRLENLYGNTLGQVLQGEDSEPEVVASVREQLELRVPFSFSITNYHSDGTSYISGVFVVPVTDPGSGKTYFLGLERKLVQGEHPLADGEFAAEVRVILLNVINLLGSLMETATDPSGDAEASAQLQTLRGSLEETAQVTRER